MKKEAHENRNLKVSCLLMFTDLCYINKLDWVISASIF